MNEVTLRQVREADRWWLWRVRNSERVRRVSTNDAPIHREDHDAWFTERLPDMRDRTVIVEWAGEAVGWFQIEKWDNMRREGEWGIAMSEAPAPIGLGGILPVVALAHAFERLEANSMTGRVLDINRTMLSIMSRLAIPTVEHATDPISRLDGTEATTYIYRVTSDSWGAVREHGLSLLPTSLREKVISSIEQPIKS